MDAVELARELIAFDSVSSRSNADVSDFVERQLSGMGFETERVTYDDGGVAKVNVIGQRGRGPGGLAYFGHTDVVPVDDWAAATGPFSPTVTHGRLVGRGSTDMKGSVACMLAAAQQLAARVPRAPLYLSCTADEEVNHGGADAIVRESRIYAALVGGRASAVVGEPTNLRVVHAHKGGCRLRVTSRGRSAHSSTREGKNANLAMIPFLVEMKRIHDETETRADWWDEEFDPPTICWNIGINDHTAATNMTPARSVCTVAFRPMPGTATNELIGRVEACAASMGLECHLEVRHAPFRADPSSSFVQEAVSLAGTGSPMTVSYGTEASNLHGLADAIILGPGDIAQAHTNDEWISLDQLARGTALYASLIQRYCL